MLISVYSVFPTVLYGKNPPAPRTRPPETRQKQMERKNVQQVVEMWCFYDFKDSYDCAPSGDPMPPSLRYVAAVSHDQVCHIHMSYVVTNLIPPIRLTPCFHNLSLSHKLVSRFRKLISWILIKGELPIHPEAAGASRPMFVGYGDGYWY